MNYAEMRVRLAQAQTEPHDDATQGLIDVLAALVEKAEELDKVTDLHDDAIDALERGAAQAEGASCADAERVADDLSDLEGRVDALEKGGPCE